MDADTPEIVEAVARAAWDASPRIRVGGPDSGAVPWDAALGWEKERCVKTAFAAIAAARPFILEEAAKVADECDNLCGMPLTPDEAHLVGRIARAIRSLSGEGLDAK